MPDDKLQKTHCDISDDCNRLFTLSELLKNTNSSPVYSEFAVWGLGDLLDEMAKSLRHSWEVLEGEDQLAKNSSDDSKSKN